jgi:hypothetical protein
VIEEFKTSSASGWSRCAARGDRRAEMLADELFLLLEGARVSAQSSAEGPGLRFVRMGEALIASHLSAALSLLSRPPLKAAPNNTGTGPQMTVSPQDQARILVEALPHMQQYDEEIVVVKYGGHAMGDEAARKLRARHRADGADRDQSGGGARRRPQIGDMLKRLGIKSEFAAGLRITDKETSRSSRWCWPARSTSRSSATSMRRAARRSASPARTATWCRRAR